MDAITPLCGPWEETLVSLVESTVRVLEVASPFVKMDALETILRRRRPEVRMHLASALPLKSFHHGVSDLSAFREFLRAGGRITNLPRLHAKVYVFDGERAVVTSANLTVRGLRSNLEYGLLIGDRGLAGLLAADFRAWCAGETASAVVDENLNDIEDLVKALPPVQKMSYPAMPGVRHRKGEVSPDALTSEEAAVIRETLSGWTRDTFDALTEIPEQDFELSEVYQFAARLAQKHPDNLHVEEKLRQQLQRLRDLGLLNFIGGGRYEKLWE